MLKKHKKLIEITKNKSKMPNKHQITNNKFQTPARRGSFEN
jgi:hypothetical protein